MTWYTYGADESYPDSVNKGKCLYLIPVIIKKAIIYMIYIIEGEGALVNPEGLTQVIPMRSTSTEIRVLNPLR
jgi:hypothetical protein